jgi:hypothetical protein
MQSLLGRLNWATAAVPAGRAFLRRLIAALAGHHKRVPVPVDEPTRADLQWWNSHLRSWNGRSLLLRDPLVAAPFGSASTTGPPTMLATDACRTGYGAVCGNTWIAGDWQRHELRMAQRAKDLSMPHLELRAILIAVNTFKHVLSNHRVVLYSDCQPAIAAVNGLSTRDTDMMNSVRTILWLAAQHNFALRLQHIAGVDNTAPDLLSRGQVQEALQLYPGLARSPHPIGPLPTRCW